MRGWIGGSAVAALDIRPDDIDSADPLRTGTYSKTLTFTLSTTNP